MVVGEGGRDGVADGGKNEQWRSFWVIKSKKFRLGTLYAGVQNESQKGEDDRNAQYIPLI